jgi:poly(A) polymerase
MEKKILTHAVHTDVTTALCFVIPDTNNSIKLINTIRQEHDRAYPRWMPHINLLFPFITEENFPFFVSKFNEKVRAKPFTLQMSRFDHFPQKKNATFHLRPIDSTPLLQIWDSIRDNFPEIPVTHPTFQAHMTLGQCK